MGSTLALPASLLPSLHSGDSRLYAVIDGAATEDVFELLPSPDAGLATTCLYAGRLSPDMARAAPYLVELPLAASYTQKLLGDASWAKLGSLATVSSNVSFKQLRRHVRHCLRARVPGLGVLAFRFYDPRVLQPFLAVCDATERAELFGPVEAFATWAQHSAQWNVLHPTE